MDSSSQIVVRFPPSPTGLLHVGNVRTALYNYLFAKQNGGQILLRIEDTDKTRSKEEYVTDMLEGLQWLGLKYDNTGNIWRQTERVDIHKQKMQELIKKGAAYISEETEGENKQVVRFKNPGGKIKFQDLIRGEVEMEVGDLGDFIIGRNIEEPLYHLAVVVDDLEAGVTHIIRGEDHISNTPRQILILEALGGNRPIYAHLPLIFATDKTKLSKRKHGEAVSLKYYREKGYEPEAIINFIAMIGWNPGTDQEIFSLEELVQSFDLSKVQKKAGIFNVEKLNWINREWILRQRPDIQEQKFLAQMSLTKFADSSKLSDVAFKQKILKILLDRIHRWGEVSEIMAAHELDYLFLMPELNAQKIAWKNQSMTEAKRHLETLLTILDKPTDILAYAEKVGKGEVLWPLRYALSGQEKSPDPFSLLNLLTPTESRERVERAISIL